MTKVVNGPGEERAFLECKCYAGILQHLQDLLKMVEWLFDGSQADEDIGYEEEGRLSLHRGQGRLHFPLGDG